MKSMFDNPYVQGYIVEITAAVIIGASAFLYGRYFERKKKAKQFYDGIMPVLKTISVVCDDGKRMNIEDIRKIVISISKSFSDVYLKDKSWLLLKNEVKREPNTPMICGICDDKLKVTQDICPHCNLDCRSWDFAKIRSNEDTQAHAAIPSA